MPPRSAVRHGLTLSVAAGERLLRTAVDRTGRQKRLTCTAPVFLTAALEYLCAELWELTAAGGVGPISLAELRRAIEGDLEFRAIFSLASLLRDEPGSEAGFLSNCWRCAMDGPDAEQWRSAAELAAYQVAAHPELTLSARPLDSKHRRLLPHRPACWDAAGQGGESVLPRWLTGMVKVV